MKNQMRASNLLLASAAVLMMSSTIASAQSNGSMYFGGHAGLNMTADADITEPVFFYGSSATFETGFALGGIVGFDLGSGLRAEGELTFRYSPLDEFSSGPGISIDGGINSLSLMGNAFYDFDTGSEFTPYIGGGLGVAFMSSDISLFGGSLIADEDTVFAYQLGAGVGYEVSPTLTITADYRFFATENPVFADFAGDNIEFEYMNHSILIGARTTF